MITRIFASIIILAKEKEKQVEIWEKRTTTKKYLKPTDIMR